MAAFGRTLRQVLDGIYFIAGVVAAGCLIVILLLIVAQMLARWTGQVFPGATDYAGYAMAAASFLAFAHALNRGAHIRVSILLNALTKGRRVLEVWCFAIATALSWYFVYYAIKTVYWSWKFHDVSQGQDATPLWIPQSPMAVGAVILAVAFTDNLIRVLLFGTHGITVDTVEQSHGE